MRQGPVAAPFFNMVSRSLGGGGQRHFIDAIGLRLRSGSSDSS